MKPKAEEKSIGAEGGSGGPSVAGYEYQIDVSVWLALELVLASRRTPQLILEPRTEEDIEADLDECQPGAVTSTATVEGYRLIVQAKLRTGNAWTVAGAKALLQHGKKRVSAAKRLADTSARYLLVTSAGLNGFSAGLRVRRPGSWPKPALMPASITKALPAGAAGRVAIIGNEDPERLDTDIRKLLLESFRVPNARLDECHAAMREEARSRIAGAGQGVWTRFELERLIQRHDGYIASSPELDRYVKPTNWNVLLGGMGTRHAALIVGQSGTGKTMATRKLYDELREKIPGLARVPITHGPQQLRDDQTAPPVLYDIEDPWGRYDFDPTSRPWNDQLAGFLSLARHDRLIVATSRLDVAQEANGLKAVEKWIVNLEADHYGPEQRRRLYQTRIDVLPRKLQPIARSSERDVLAELATPLEIQKFFDALPTVDEDNSRNERALVREAIDRAHENSIELTVVNQIEARDDVRAATVIWALLKVTDRLSLGLVQQIEEYLAEQDNSYERGVLPLIRFFVAARNLRQGEGSFTYYHPRVEAGIEQALLRAHLTVRRTLRLLIDFLVSPVASNAAWGTEMAARLVHVGARTPNLLPTRSAGAQSRIDTWLAEQLAKGGSTLDEMLKIAAAAGSSASNPSEAARFLCHRPRQDFPGLLRWGPPQHDDAWHQRMSGDPAVKSLVEAFVREVLPHSRAHFPPSFVAAAEKVAPGLTSAFVAAASVSVHWGVADNTDVIAEGALGDLAGFESIVDTAFDVLNPSDADLEKDAETHLAIVNGEYSEDYAEHLADNDDGYTAREFLQAYVDHVRGAVGWRRLAEHPHRAKLRYYWFNALARDKAATAEEVANAFAAGYATEDEGTLWDVVSTTWNAKYECALLERLVVGHDRADARRSALKCSITRAPHLIGAVVDQLEAAGALSRAIQMVIELGELRDPKTIFDEEPTGEAASRAAEALPPPLREICDAALALATHAAPVLSKPAREYFEQIPSASEEVRVFRLKLDETVPMNIAEDVRWLLANSEDYQSAVTAMDAAVRHEMAAEVDAGLSHRFARVVASALTAHASGLEPPLSPAILDFADTKGSHVRRALVELLKVKSHPDHLPTLLQLAKDKWSSQTNFEIDRYPIAAEAVAAIEKLGEMKSEVGNELYQVAIDTRDPYLRADIFALLARLAGSKIQGQLFDLAITPGRRNVKLAASQALMMAHQEIDLAVLERITPDLLRTRIEPVAARLLILACARATSDQAVAFASALATNDKRRVMLLLVIWVMRDRDMAAAERVVNMLPVDHPGSKWALAGAPAKLPEGTLDDLGDPLSVEQVMSFMQPESDAV